MYVATNQGMLYLLPVGKKPSKWKAVYAGQRRNVMVSLEVIFAEREEKKKDKKEEEEDDSLYNHFVCAGDIYGHVSMVSVLAPDGDCENFKIGSCLEWQAHPGRRVLGIFKVRANPEADGNDAFGERQQLTLFSTDSSGEVKWWKFASGDLVAGQAQAAPLLLAKLQSPLKRRILCLDVCFASKLIVCGDQNGSVMAFKYHQGQDPTKELELVTMLRSQHGVNAVTLMKFNDMNELISGGRDGKLFNYEIRSSPGEGSNTAPSASSLCPIGVHSVNNVAAIEDYIDLGDQMKFVAGFQSTDFVVWNIVDDCQLIHSHCGGWRRPHSFIMDKTGELTFAYLKNEMIFVHLLSQKRDQAETESKQEEAALVEVEGDSNCSVFSNALAPTFHGCEIHSTKLLQSSFLNSEERNTYFAMTGSEDGCVRYSKWHFSREENAFRLEGTGLVGEFIAGAAVRELSYCKCWNLNLGRSTNVYLTSVGAKEVVMVWNLFCGTTAKSNGKQRNLRNKCIGMKIPKGGLRPKSYATKDSIDLRHLAVDTFAVSCTEDVDVIFMLLSSADATLRLAALEYNRLSGYTKWHEGVCDLMEGGQNPTLSIACKLFQDGENESSSSTLMDNQRVVAFTGSTDGTLCCWDLSGVVKLFMCSLGAHDDMPPQRMRVVPIAKYRGVHESGVNSLEISSIKRKDDADASSGGVCCVCVVSGGDDQAIHVKDVVLSSNQQENERSSEDANGMSTILRVISCLDAHVANAHFSSLKGVWTSGDVVASTGIDQRLNLWKIQRVGSSSSEGGKKEILQLLLKGSRCVEAGETESLDVVMHQHDDNDDDNEEAAEPLCQIALVGRGLNLICIKEESVL
jgi:WD40 repeat protein